MHDENLRTSTETFSAWLGDSCRLCSWTSSGFPDLLACCALPVTYRVRGEQFKVLLNISESFSLHNSSYHSLMQLKSKGKKAFWPQQSENDLNLFTSKADSERNCRYVVEEEWWLICNLSWRPTQAHTHTHAHICTTKCAHTLIYSHTQTDLPWWVLWVTVDYRAVKLGAGRRQLDEGMSC